ncbi:Methyltransferase domain [Desmophyllum pertusum]|uniref:Methyltransferase domain n=1 Tax=Desmophyllum pertusum TaxID=174260 RepID=A0A9X0CR63_9CNID|nr:Methyltransferase domain [Desmophyllum pertusum]
MGCVIPDTMTEVIKYTQRFLKLGVDSTLEESKLAYDEMASCWEKISDNTGYKGHILCVEAFDRAMQAKDVYSNPRKDMKILDVGAGTGGIGEMLKAREYTNVDALDISQEMLNLAASKNLYKKLICAPLTDKHMEEVETAGYDVVLCAGTIVYGQVKPGAIEQCARFVKPGGLFIFSIRVDSFDPAGLGFSEKCEELEKTGKWLQMLKERRELHATPNEERFRYCYVITYKILQ